MQNRDLRSERKKHRYEENRSFIIEAAESVFAKKGYSAATMDEIAEAAQFSKATIYTYFKGKSDIFSEIIFNAFDEVYTKLKKVVATDSSPSEKLRSYIYTILTFFQDKRNLVRIFFMEIPAVKKIFRLSNKHIMHPMGRKEIPFFSRMHLDKYRELTRSIIQEGIDRGEFREVDVRDAENIFGSMVRGFSFGSFGREENYSISQSVDLLYSYFLNGIKKDKNA